MDLKINKDKLQNILIVVLVIAIVLVLISMFISDGTLFAKRNTYVLSPEMCRLFYSTTPEDFFEDFNPLWGDSCEDFKKHARVDKDGNLVLRLTEEQENAHIQAWNSNLEEFKKVSGVEIADDYSYVTITGNKEEIKHILQNHLHFFFLKEMPLRQLYNGKKPETITLTFSLIESSTGKTVYTATWPQETITITFNMDELPFSE